MSAWSVTELEGGTTYYSLEHLAGAAWSTAAAETSMLVAAKAKSLAQGPTAML